MMNQILSQFNQTHKKIPFFQRHPGPCGSYALANLFNKPIFLRDTENVRKGERIVDLNRKMVACQPDMYIEPIFYTEHTMPPPMDRLHVVHPLELDMGVFDEDQIANWLRPVLVTFWRSDRPTPMYHTIAVVHELATKMYYLLDSMEEFILRYNVFEFVNKYHIVMMEGFGSWDHPHIDNSVFLHRSACAHFLPDM